MYPESTRNFESNKILSGVGALLVAIGSFLPASGVVGIVAIVGIILVLIGMRGLSDDFKDGSIYRNALYGFMFGIVAILAGIVVFVAVFFAFFSGAFFIQPFGFGLGILGAVVALVVVFIFFLLEAIFYKQAFDVLSDRSGERLFRTGGLMLLLGAVLTIVIIGFILLFVAWIILAVGFFSMRPPSSAAPATNAAPSATTFTAPATGQGKYCPYCGAENKLETPFCTHCGRKLQSA